MDKTKVVFVVVYVQGEDRPLIADIAYREERKAIAFADNKKLIYPYRTYLVLECYLA